MKTLNECKNYYMDVYTDYITDQENQNEYTRFRMHRETLLFIYGEEFKKIENNWQNEALKNIYAEFNECMM